MPAPGAFGPLSEIAYPILIEFGVWACAAVPPAIIPESAVATAIVDNRIVMIFSIDGSARSVVPPDLGIPSILID